MITWCRKWSNINLICSDHIPKCCHGNVAKDCYFCIMDEDNNGFTYPESRQSTPRKPIQRKLLREYSSNNALMTSSWRHRDVIVRSSRLHRDVIVGVEIESLDNNLLRTVKTKLIATKWKSTAKPQIGTSCWKQYHIRNVRDDSSVMTHYSCPNRQINCQNPHVLQIESSSSLEHVY